MKLDTRTMTRIFSILFLALAMACSETASDGAGGAGGPGGEGGGGGGGGSGQGGSGGSEPECVDDQDCDDGDECTADVCSMGGVCENTASDDGTECSLGICVFGVCEPVELAVPCTEEAIRQAVTDGGGPYGFLCEGQQPILTAAEIVIDNDVILDGLGNLTIDAGGQHRPISVLEGVTVQLRRLIIAGGAAPEGSGGGLLNDGTLTLVDSSVTGSTAPSSGGGINNFGRLTIVRSSVSGNTAVGGNNGGGGGVMNTGMLTIMDSTVSGNETGPDSDGGGLMNTGTLTMTGCTVSGNEASRNGGGIANSNVLMLLNSTISGNTAAQNGGGIRNNSVVSITHCTLSENSASEGSAFGNGGVVNAMMATVIDGGCATGMSAIWISDDYNIESPGDTCELDQPNDQVDVSPQSLGLGALLDNGGPTQTHALESGSPAVDSIEDVMCDTQNDQRGVARPQGPACDVGAFELEP